MLLAFNKPYGVICQFSPSGDKRTLKNYIATKDIYPAGRLDTDSEGLMLLTDDGILQARLTDPESKLTKTYWAEVEGQATNASLASLLGSLDLGDFITSPALRVEVIATPQIWPRDPPVRFRANIPTSWISITITEGKNRQVRRMTAKVGFPTLRLIRVAIGTLDLIQLVLASGKSVEISQLDMGLGIARRRRKPKTKVNPTEYEKKQ